MGERLGSRNCSGRGKEVEEPRDQVAEKNGCRSEADKAPCYWPLPRGFVTS